MATMNGEGTHVNGHPNTAAEAAGSTYGTIGGSIGAKGEVKSAPYGDTAVKEILKQETTPSAPGKDGEDDIQLVLQTFRLLIADLCQQFNMGHPG